MEFHESVLLMESVDGLNIRPDGVYVDATFGGGGHSKEILRRLSENGRLFGFDHDIDSLENTIDDSRLTMINNNFEYIKNFLKFYKTNHVDGILADLGISSHQINTPERGFSTRFEGDLDMRMDQRQGLSARDVVNQYEESKLSRIFYEYGEIKNAGKLAKIIVSNRKEKEIDSTSMLKSIITPFAVRGKENKYLAQVFQSLRIEVNEELESLKQFLSQSSELLVTGGRLVVISYHSLEDKLVKNFIRAGNFQGVIQKDFYGNPLVPFNIITRKPVIPSDLEIERNNRARSARLRIAEKL
jgi:16S rRNA (cytosine1402-N4)-methyltransferase